MGSGMSNRVNFQFLDKRFDQQRAKIPVTAAIRTKTNEAPDGLGTK
jgi:hypothetical protein